MLWTPAWSRLWVRLLATVARIARPSAPPTCWEVLISPEARPASCGLVPVTAAIVTGTNAKPSPNAASSDGPEHVRERSEPPGAGTRENQKQAGGDQQQAADQRRLEADARDQLRGAAGGQDDPDRERQVGEAGLDRRVASTSCR